MTVHLRYFMLDAPQGHPRDVLASLGITYTDVTPQTMGDQLWLWNCRGVPADLPKYIEPLNITPADAVGWGLTEQQARDIAAKGAEP